MNDLKCLQCGSVNLKNDRSLAGRLICADCGSHNIAPSPFLKLSRMTSRVKSIELKSLPSSFSKFFPSSPKLRKVVLGSASLVVVLIAWNFFQGGRKYCGNSLDGQEVCIYRKK